MWIFVVFFKLVWFCYGDSTGFLQLPLPKGFGRFYELIIGLTGLFGFFKSLIIREWIKLTYFLNFSIDPNHFLNSGLSSKYFTIFILMLFVIMFWDPMFWLSLHFAEKFVLIFSLMKVSITLSFFKSKSSFSTYSEFFGSSYSSSDEDSFESVFS